MNSTVNPDQTNPHDVLEITPGVVLVGRADKKPSDEAGDAVNRPADSQPSIAPGLSAGPSVRPVVDTTFRAAAVNDVPNDAKIPGDRPSMSVRAVRACIGFLLAVCIGVAATLWQSYGDAAKSTIAGWIPQLGLTSSPQENPELAEQTTGQASAENAAAAQPQPGQAAPEVAASTGTAVFTPESAQLLQSMAGDLAHADQEIEQLKASIAQLKASQQQMSRDIAKATDARASEAKPSGPKTSGPKTSGPRASGTGTSGAGTPERSLREKLSAAVRRSAVAPARKRTPLPYPPPQATAAPASQQAAAPSVPQQPEPQSLATARAELAPRPPMPLR